MHFADWFARHAVTRPNVAAIVTPKSRLTYSEFNRALHVAARKLAELGFARGQTVGLCIANQALHCVLIAALNRMGVVSVSLPSGQKTAVAMPAGFALAGVVADAPVAWADNALTADLSWLKQESGEPFDGEGFADENDIVRIFATSGTTGSVKLIGHSTRQLEDRIFKYSIGALAESRSGAGISQLGVRSAVGFRAVFIRFWSGGTVLLGWPERAVPGLLGRYRIERIDASPVQYRNIIRAAGKDHEAPASLRLAIVAGSMTPKPLVVAIRKRLCATLINSYGTSELGVLAFGPLTERTLPEVAGVLSPWIEAQVVDDDDQPLPPGNEGTLRFRSLDMPRGYIGDPEASSEHFRDGWFYPGDRGMVSAGRVLVIKGRGTDQINAGGMKVAPEIVEEVVLAFDGIEECAAFGVPDAAGLEVIWTAFVASADVDLEKLTAHCAAKLGGRAPQRLFKLEQIPRNENGKVLRGELKKLARSM